MMHNMPPFSLKKDISYDVLSTSLYRTGLTSRPHGEDPSFALTWDPFCATPILQITHNPPYNTGSEDFIYDDNYVDALDGYRHSKWLSFICNL